MWYSLNPIPMLLAPLAQRQQCLRERHAELRYRVLDFRRHLPIVVAHQDSGRSQLAQMLDKHLLTYSDDQPLKVTEAARTAAQVI